MSMVLPIVLVVMLLFLALSLFGWILFCVGLYHDAQGTYNQKPMMWAMLTAFFGTIPMLIYLCTRKNKWTRMPCPRCFRSIAFPQPSSACPFCGQETGIQIPPEHPNFPALRQKGKKQMITGAIFYVASYILFFAGYLAFFFVLMGNIAY